MSIKQLSVFVQNEKGSLKDVTDILAEEDIDLRALSIADTSDFGILRIIVNDIDKAKKILEDSGYIVSETRVLGISIDDRPGGLTKILGILQDNDINMEYMYAFVAKHENEAFLAIRVDDTDGVDNILKENGIRLLAQDDIENM